MNRCRHLDRSGYIQAIEPFGIRAAPLRIEVLSNLCHMAHIVAYMLPFDMLLRTLNTLAAIVVITIMVIAALVTEIWLAARSRTETHQ